MRKFDGWVNALFALVFIAVPALLIYMFLLPTWTDKEVVPYWSIWLIAIAFLIFASLFTFILIWYKWMSIDSITFNIPLSIALMAILVTYPLPLWAVAVFVLLTIFTAIPANMAVTRYKEMKIAEYKRKRK